MTDFDAPGVAGKKSLESLVGDLYGFVKNTINAELISWKAMSDIAVLSKRLAGTRFVKTLLHLEKAIDLEEFYHPAQVFAGEARKLVTCADELPNPGNQVIEGVIGQGKSIFLRYLASRTLEKGKPFPLFVELRRLSSSEGVLGLLLNELKALGLEMSAEAFAILADDGRFALFLDGFDELSDAARGPVITELETMARRYEKMRILVTCRPGGDLQKSSLFGVTKIAPFNAEEYASVVQRLVDAEVATSILAEVKASRVNVRPLLTTPLMVTLLVVRYLMSQSIPEKEVGFFGDLFDLLLHRHDRMKPAFVRPRKGSLNNSQLKDVFDALCFLCRKSPDGIQKTAVLRERVREAVAKCALTADPAAVLDDVVDITCLVLVEGSECRFIHRSVLEYHAAAFVMSRPDHIAKIFYDHMLSSWRNWRQELIFLSTIDEYRFLKYFLIPQYLALTGTASAAEVSKLPESADTMLILFGDDAVDLTHDESGRVSLKSFMPKVSYFRGNDLYHGGMDEFLDLMHTCNPRLPKVPFEDGRKSREFTVRELLSVSDCRGFVEWLYLPALRNFKADLTSAESRITEIDKTKTMFDI